MTKTVHTAMWRSEDLASPPLKQPPPCEAQPPWIRRIRRQERPRRVAANRLPAGQGAVGKAMVKRFQRLSSVSRQDFPHIALTVPCHTLTPSHGRVTAVGSTLPPRHVACVPTGASCSLGWFARVLIG